MYRAAIRNIPHTRAGLAAIERLRVRPGHVNTVRGRGHRYMGGPGRNRPFDQDLPRELATHFTLYTVPSQPHREHRYQYADYVRTEPNGKIRLRCQANTAEGFNNAG